jgi:hypothetical protein
MDLRLSKAKKDPVTLLQCRTWRIRQGSRGSPGEVDHVHGASGQSTARSRIGRIQFLDRGLPGPEGSIHLSESDIVLYLARLSEWREYQGKHVLIYQGRPGGDAR